MTTRRRFTTFFPDPETSSLYRMAARRTRLRNRAVTGSMAKNAASWESLGVDVAAHHLMAKPAAPARQPRPHDQDADTPASPHDRKRGFGNQSASPVARPIRKSRRENGNTFHAMPNLANRSEKRCVQRWSRSARRCPATAMATRSLS